MKRMLQVLVVVGLMAVCNDTRGATWLALPGTLAAVTLWAPLNRQKRNRPPMFAASTARPW